MELKRESHAARWGLLRGYSGKATKWVDFVRTGSTQRKREEPCPIHDFTESQSSRQATLFRICAAGFRSHSRQISSSRS